MIPNTLIRRIKLAGITLSLVFSFVLLSTVSADAQWRDGGRRNERRWGNTNKRAVENLIRRVEQRTDVFVRQFDRALDNGRADGTRREDRLNEFARQLESATDELRREFDRGDSLQENRDEVQRVISIASRIDQAMRRGRVAPGAQGAWRNLRGELNSLARIYNVRSV
jgi:hypothetical protein